ncbi:DUF1501 domain-containing protein [Elioraea sp.]|uniref:DUF1501 domain-containing protein n=1 Tax=Elioraea sp. TaxID=2185103 RepID=UPI003F6E5D67
MRFTRRGVLLGLGALAAFGHRAAFGDAPGERRFVVVILRGGLDGLGAVVPYADPAHAVLRQGIALAEPGSEDGLLDLGGRFGLHPALAAVHALYRHGEAAIVHAVAGPYRSRSHFDAQDAMESGAEQRLADGWLNRAVATLWPADLGPVRGRSRHALATGQTVPLVLKGPAAVTSYATARQPEVSRETMDRLAALYARDPLLGPVVREGQAGRRFAAGAMGSDHGPMANLPGERAAFVALAEAAGRLLAAPDGPRVAALETGGFDTHAFQPQRLAAALSTLDGGIAALRQGLGAAWRETAVLVMTEFGRTARVNGTLGTDHGTGGVAFALGGRIAGGRVLGDWPGLSEDALFERRDLRPTTDLRAVAKALLAGHLGVPRAALDGAVFPESASVAPFRDLVA